MKHSLYIRTRVFSEQSTEKTFMTGKNGKKYAIRANHPVAQRKRNRIQAAAVKEVWKCEPRNIQLPCKVTLISISEREKDFDNFVYSMKFFRDAIADLILPGMPPGRADGDKRITWDYKQEKGSYGVRIEIEHE